VWRDVDPLPALTGPPPGVEDQPLGGLRVIDTATFLAAPFVATLLAAHGADVVKVDSPAGDLYSVFNVAFAAVHEHKPRLTSDLSDPASRVEFLEMVATADVLIDNLITSSLVRLQLGPEAFARANPDLVRCLLTAYGAEGPLCRAARDRSDHADAQRAREDPGR
jgi:crotonobetainyl-CoA:carnitine CoA-transferase CaiB-like acyl-CoA transferase